MSYGVFRRYPGYYPPFNRAPARLAGAAAAPVIGVGQVRAGGCGTSDLRGQQLASPTTENYLYQAAQLLGASYVNLAANGTNIWEIRATGASLFGQTWMPSPDPALNITALIATNRNVAIIDPGPAWISNNYDTFFAADPTIGSFRNFVINWEMPAHNEVLDALEAAGVRALSTGGARPNDSDVTTTSLERREILLECSRRYLKGRWFNQCSLTRNTNGTGRGSPFGVDNHHFDLATHTLFARQLADLWRLIPDGMLLSIEPPPVDVTLSAAAGAATATGQTAAVTAGVTISAAAGSATAADQSVTLSSGVTVSAASGSASASGLAAQAQAAAEYQASASAATAAALSASASAGATQAASGGAATATGLAADATAGLIHPAGAGAATATGQTATCSAGSVVQVATCQASATGLDIQLSSDGAFVAAAGSAVATGLTAATLSGSVVSAQAATASASGLSASYSWGALIVSPISQATAQALPVSLDGSAAYSAASGSALAEALTVTLSQQTVLFATLGLATATSYLTSNNAGDATRPIPAGRTFVAPKPNRTSY